MKYEGKFCTMLLITDPRQTWKLTIENLSTIWYELKIFQLQHKTLTIRLNEGIILLYFTVVISSK